jgi:hypothetical protein
MHDGACQSALSADRGTMEGSLHARIRALSQEVRALPPAEQLRFAADLLEKGCVTWAQQVTAHVVQTWAAEARVK